MEPQPSNFTNWGNELIRRSTGSFGDFKMDVAIALVRTERHARGWVDAMTEDDIRRVLARYKEHVSYWNIPITAVQNEVTQFAEAMRRNQDTILMEFNGLPAQRFQSPGLVAGWFSQVWKSHLIMRPGQNHQPVLQAETDVVMKLYCLFDQEVVSRYNVLPSDRETLQQLFYRHIG